MVNKLLSALITSFFICMLLAYMEYTPMNERSGDTYYFSYFSLVTIYLFYAVPITFFLGIPFSFLIEFISGKLFVRSKVKKYFLSICLYSLAGVVTGLLFFMINSGTFFIRVSNLYSLVIFIVPALIFYHISILIRFKKRNLNN